jgi:hypothetical protein
MKRLCHQGHRRVRGLLAVIIRLFEVESLEVTVSDSQGNTEEVNWDEGAIAVLAGVRHVRLSKQGKLVCIIISYERRNLQHRRFHNHSPRDPRSRKHPLLLHPQSSPCDYPTSLRSPLSGVMGKPCSSSNLVRIRLRSSLSLSTTPSVGTPQARA